MQNLGIGPWPARRAQRRREGVALVFREQRITFGELDTRVTRLANALATRGVQRGDRVAYLGNNHPSFLEALFAVALLGAVFVPLNTRLAPPEIGFALTDSGASVLIYGDSLEELALTGSTDTAVRLRIRVADDRADLAPTTDAIPTEGFEHVLESGTDQAVLRGVSLEDPALILYTSGTTGRPKGAVLTHGNLTWNCFNALVDAEIAHGESVLLISPLFHVASLCMGALPVLLQGGTTILHEKFDPGAVLRTVQEERVSMLSGVPTTFQMIQEHPDFESTDISSLVHLTCGGSTMPKRMLEAYEARGLRFACGYGMTETSPGATQMPPHMSLAKIGSSGVAEFFTDVKIVDPAGEELPSGEIGEIWVRGPNVIREYWNRPAATAEALVDGWFRSGDLGWFDSDGFIFVTDRLKDMIISGGENIYSAEVEGAIMEIAEVASVALIGVPDPKWGEAPLAVVVLHPGAELAASEIVTHLQGRLARYKIPREVVFVDELPRTASGKIRKAELRARYGTPQGAPAHSMSGGSQ